MQKTISPREVYNLSQPKHQVIQPGMSQSKLVMHVDQAQIYEVWSNYEFHSESWDMRIVISLEYLRRTGKKLLPWKPASNPERTMRVPHGPKPAASSNREKIFKKLKTTLDLSINSFK